jgi:hypothetical protein
MCLQRRSPCDRVTCKFSLADLAFSYSMGSRATDCKSTVSQSVERHRSQMTRYENAWRAEQAVRLASGVVADLNNSFSVSYPNLVLGRLSDSAFYCAAIMSRLPLDLTKCRSPNRCAHVASAPILTSRPSGPRLTRTATTIAATKGTMAKAKL